MHLKHLFLLALSFVFLSCMLATDGIDVGIYQDGHYFNKQFNLNIPLPENWHYVKGDSKVQVARQNLENVLGDNGEIEEEIVLEKNALIFALFKFDPQAEMVVNPNMTMTASDIKETPELANPGTQLRLAREGLLDSGIDIEFAEGEVGARVNGKRFSGMKYQITNTYGQGQYESYVANYGDYNLLITISYSTDAERSELFEVIRGIEKLQ